MELMVPIGMAQETYMYRTGMSQTGCPDTRYPPIH